MVRTSAVPLLLVCAACLPLLSGPVRSAAPEPPYAILLRSRSAVVTPEKSKEAQTGGGFIQVTQLEPNLIMVLMRGAVVAGSEHQADSASMQFDLNQDFEIVPTRKGLRPPRLTLAAWAIGCLNSTLPEGGTADHGAGCACVQFAGQQLLNVCVKPHSVAGGQNLLVNDRVGPMEVPATPGAYCLHQTFALNANQQKSRCHPGSAAADFDPDPKFDSRWNTVMKPFRAVPHKDFGFRAILRVVEEPPPSAPSPETLPPPGRAGKEEVQVPGRFDKETPAVRRADKEEKEEVPILEETPANP